MARQKFDLEEFEERMLEKLNRRAGGIAQPETTLLSGLRSAIQARKAKGIMPQKPVVPQV